LCSRELTRHDRTILRPTRPTSRKRTKHQQERCSSRRGCESKGVSKYRRRYRGVRSNTRPRVRSQSAETLRPYTQLDVQAPCPSTLFRLVDQLRGMPQLLHYSDSSCKKLSCYCPESRCDSLTLPNSVFLVSIVYLWITLPNCTMQNFICSIFKRCRDH
jgi:hypothetical protein